MRANGRCETEVERRKTARYGLRVPVLFGWGDTQPAQARGVTRDISASGAYVICEKNYCPADGDTLAIQLILPPIANMEAQGMKLEFKGQVLRSGDFQEESGFAALAEHGMELNSGRKNSGQSWELT
jgi:hypothetical protein